MGKKHAIQTWRFVCTRIRNRCSASRVGHQTLGHLRWPCYKFWLPVALPAEKLTGMNRSTMNDSSCLGCRIADPAVRDVLATHGSLFTSGPELRRKIPYRTSQITHFRCKACCLIPVVVVARVNRTGTIMKRYSFLHASCGNTADRRKGSVLLVGQVAEETFAMPELLDMIYLHRRRGRCMQRVASPSEHLPPDNDAILTRA
jgi:hypothetical protein